MMDVLKEKYVYKVLTPDQWAKFQHDLSFLGSPVDFEDGYIHLSSASQLKVTMDKWYAQASQVVVLQVRVSNISAKLKYEISRGGAPFPHLYAELPIAAIGEVWLVSLVKGVYTLPDTLTSN